MTLFAERLKALRASRRLSQSELAEKTGLSRSLISMLESGARSPRTEHLEALADFFNVDMEYLLGRSEKTTVLDPEQFFAQQLYYNEGVMMRHFDELADNDKQFIRDMVERLWGGKNEDRTEEAEPDENTEGSHDGEV